MAPVRSDVGERHEDERPLVHPRMRQEKAGRRLALGVAPPRHPGADGCGIRANLAPAAQKVEVADTGSPTHAAGAAKAILDRMKPGEHRLGAEVGGGDHRGVHEVRPGTGWPGRCAKVAACVPDGQTLRHEFAKRAIKHLARRVLRSRQVRAESNEVHMCQPVPMGLSPSIAAPYNSRKIDRNPDGSDPYLTFIPRRN